MSTSITRRDFIRRSITAGMGAAFAASAWTGRPFAGTAPPADMTVVTGDSPVRNTLAAVEGLGGFSRFVRPGDRVCVKPNPIGSFAPERAINTHPEMVETVVRECLRCGADEVIVLSNDEEQSFRANGTFDAVERAGGRVVAAQSKEQYREVIVPRGRTLRRVEIAKDVLDADLFINMPIAKHHAGSRATFAMKNLMGVNWDRQYFHRTDLQQCIAELASGVRHGLVIMDANHVLLSNGPAGPGRVLRARQVVASVDPVAVDAFAARYLGLLPEDIPHIRTAYEIGVGEIDLAKLAVREIAA